MTASRRVVWLVTLTVAAAAVVATAHGLYEVAVASGVTPAVAVTYPIMADGLALVAYASTRHLTDGGRRYAWTIVVVSACLSGLGQAAWLAGGVAAAPWWLRAGVGAWPALAAVVAAHLVYLTGQRQGVGQTARTSADPVSVIRSWTQADTTPDAPNGHGDSQPVRTALTGDLADRIRSYATDNPGASRQDIAGATGCSVRTVQRHLGVDKATT